MNPDIHLQTLQALNETLRKHPFHPRESQYIECLGLALTTELLAADDVSRHLVVTLRPVHQEDLGDSVEAGLIQVCIRHLKSPNAAQRRAAAQRLGVMCAAEASPALARIADGDPASNVREEASQALQRMQSPRWSIADCTGLEVRLEYGRQTLDAITSERGEAWLRDVPPYSTAWLSIAMPSRAKVLSFPPMAPAIPGRREMPWRLAASNDECSASPPKEE